MTATISTSTSRQSTADQPCLTQTSQDRNRPITMWARATFEQGCLAVLPNVEGGRSLVSGYARLGHQRLHSSPNLARIRTKKRAGASYVYTACQAKLGKPHHCRIWSPATTSTANHCRRRANLNVRDFVKLEEGQASISHTDPRSLLLIVGDENQAPGGIEDDPDLKRLRGPLLDAPMDYERLPVKNIAPVPAAGPVDTMGHPDAKFIQQPAQAGNHFPNQRSSGRVHI